MKKLIIAALCLASCGKSDSDMFTSQRIAENTLYANHGWHCAVQDVEMVHVTDDPKFNGDASTARCARFERDGDWPSEFHERWHVWSHDGFLPKGAKEWAD